MICARCLQVTKAGRTCGFWLVVAGSLEPFCGVATGRGFATWESWRSLETAAIFSGQTREGSTPDPVLPILIGSFCSGIGGSPKLIPVPAFAASSCWRTLQILWPLTPENWDDTSEETSLLGGTANSSSPGGESCRGAALEGPACGKPTTFLIVFSYFGAYT